MAFNFSRLLKRDFYSLVNGARGTSSLLRAYLVFKEDYASGR